ncbi:hypothetical protein BKA62DRAFT_685722 [Auriculariales sp. MPI-PUGE-AT-0066]|nr:hypothetical protein BKA62DRAFT_685722 [Auriculariales sp. MPI-PUGE-AT-0066]
MNDALSFYPSSSDNQHYLPLYFEELRQESFGPSTGPVLFAENVLELDLGLDSVIQTDISDFFPHININLLRPSSPPAVTTSAPSSELVQTTGYNIAEEEAPFMREEAPVLCVDPKLLITPSRPTISLPVEPTEPEFNSSDDGSADSDTEVDDDPKAMHVDSIEPSPATTLGKLSPASPQHKKLETRIHPGPTRTERPKTLSPHYMPYVRQSAKALSPFARFHPSPTSSTTTSPGLSTIGLPTLDNTSAAVNISAFGQPEHFLDLSVATSSTSPRTIIRRAAITRSSKKRVHTYESDAEDEDPCTAAPAPKRARSSVQNVESEVCSMPREGNRDYEPDNDSDSDGSEYDSSCGKPKLATKPATSTGRSSRAGSKFSCDAEVWKWVRGRELKVCQKQAVKLESISINQKKHFLRFAVCGKTFGRAAELERHTLDHVTLLEDMTFHVPGHICGVCGEQQFTFRTDNLERHQKSAGCRAHQSELPTAKRKLYLVASMSEDRKRALKNGMNDMDGDEIAFNVAFSQRRK